MTEFKQFQDHIDKLVLVYMEHTCDISSMSVEEYIKKFNEISEEIFNAYPEKPKKPWLY